MKTDYSFNRRQLLAACTVFFLAPALRLVPTASASAAGRAAWVSVPAALPVLFLYIWFLHTFLMRRQNNEGFAELILRALGMRAGKTALVLLSLWFLLYGGLTLLSGAERIMTTMYPSSGPEVFVLTMGVLCLIAALSSARSIIRTANLLLPTVLGVLLLVLIFALFSVRPENLLPVTAADAAGILKGSAATVDVVVMPAYTACFLSNMKPDTSTRLRDPLMWVLGVVLLLFWLITDIVGCFGAELAARLTHPFFTLVKNLVFFRNLERVEALLVSLWVFSDFIVISLCIFVAQYCLRLAMGKSADYAGEKAMDMRSGRWVIWLCAAAAVVTALEIPSDPLSLDTWSKMIVPCANLAVAFIVLPLIFIIGKIRKTL